MFRDAKRSASVSIAPQCDSFQLTRCDMAVRAQSCWWCQGTRSQHIVRTNALQRSRHVTIMLPTFYIGRILRWSKTNAVRKGATTRTRCLIITVTGYASSPKSARTHLRILRNREPLCLKTPLPGQGKAPAKAGHRPVQAQKAISTVFILSTRDS